VPGAFFDCWSPDNIVEPFNVPNWWTVFRSCDWGFATPFSIGEWAISDGTPVETRSGEVVTHPPGAMIRIWEWYGANPDKTNEGLRMDPGAIAGEILRARGKARPGPGDPSMWRSEHGPSFGEKFARAGMSFYKADNSREAGWQEMYRRIKSGMLLVTTDCRDFMRTIPTLIADPVKPDDVLKQGEDHIGDECFVAGTRILTESGERPIESMRVGDRVWTRSGLASVSAVFSVGEREVYDVPLSNGRTLTGTGNHPVFVGNRFVPLSGLRYNSLLWTHTRTNIEKSPAAYGVRRMAESLLGIMSTILTGIRQITAFPIWSAFRRLSIGQSTLTQGLSPAATIVEADSWGLSGHPNSVAMPANRPRAAGPASTMSTGYATHAAAGSYQTNSSHSGTAHSAARQMEPTNARWERIYAGIAEQASKLRARRNGVLTVAENPRIAGRQKVYNLTVDGAEEYFAEGALVHNCRYACMSRPLKTEKPKPKRPANDPIRFSDLVEFPQRVERWI